MFSEHKTEVRIRGAEVGIYFRLIKKEIVLKNVLVGFGFGVLLLIGFYLFIHIPEKEESYKRGLEQCQKDTDTVVVHGKPTIEYRDTSFASIESVESFETDTLLTLNTSFDTTTVSGKDTIGIKTNTRVEVKKEGGTWDLSNPLAFWELEIEHKDFEQLPDTIKIYTPKYIETVIEEIDWKANMFSFIGGIILTILTFWLAG